MKKKTHRFIVKFNSIEFNHVRILVAFQNEIELFEHFLSLALIANGGADPFQRHVSLRGLMKNPTHGAELPIAYLTEIFQIWLFKFVNLYKNRA